MSKSCLVRRGKPGGCGVAGTVGGGEGVQGALGGGEDLPGSPDHLVAVAGAPLNLATALSTPAKARWSAEGSWAAASEPISRTVTPTDTAASLDGRGHGRGGAS